MKLSFHHGGCHDSCCLRVNNVSVTIGGENVLSNVNLHVHCGQLVALIGPNGAGKSTLLKALLGQREFDGNIVFSVPGERHVPAGRLPGGPDGGLPVRQLPHPLPYRPGRALLRRGGGLGGAAVFAGLAGRGALAVKFCVIRRPLCSDGGFFVIMIMLLMLRLVCELG